MCKLTVNYEEAVREISVIFDFCDYTFSEKFLDCVRNTRNISK